MLNSVFEIIGLTFCQCTMIDINSTVQNDESMFHPSYEPVLSPKEAMTEKAVSQHPSAPLLSDNSKNNPRYVIENIELPQTTPPSNTPSSSNCGIQ
jgi:hypothetical protein